MNGNPEPAEGPRWTHHPLAGRKGAKVFLALLLPFLGCAVWLESRNLALTVLAVVLVALAVSPALASTHFALDGEGLTVRHLGRRTRQSWDTFRRVIVDQDVLVVSPFPRPCFLGSFRGVYLRFNRDQEAVREAVLRFVLDRMPRAGDSYTRGAHDGAHDGSGRET